MKRNILILFALAQVMLMRAQIAIYQPMDNENGEAIDTVLYSVGYDLAFVKDAGKQPYKPQHEQMTLDVGRHTACFFSYIVAKSDSIVGEEIKKGNKEIHSAGQISWRVYCDYPQKGQYQHLDRLGIDRFIITNDMPEPQWTLCADSPKTILGYSCQKATATVLGREWAAWYAEDLPIDAGPWLLRGLPGLILQAESADSCFCFKANGLAKGRQAQPIYYKGAKYEAISHKTLASVYKRYFADPVGYITNNPNVTVVTLDEKGNVTNKRLTTPYNMPDKGLCE